ncbi:MAG: hypothetical protein HY451_00040, partial [Parcubacteria group bacterium]|nr:hypothetical protein [Parcubacteria group bacterium]
VYPHYSSLYDWIRLYTIIYPFGGLAILESVYFLGGLFGERFNFIRKPQSFLHVIVDKADIILIIVIFFSPAIAVMEIFDGLPFTTFMILATLVWVIVATIKLKYHLAHWSHYVAIFLLTLLVSVFLHEIPNIGTFEWRYQNAPFFNQTLLGIPLWVIAGWYVLVVGMLRLWLYLVLGKRQK